MKINLKPKKIFAFLDDTAQIIGPAFTFDQEVKGRSEREKAIGRFVLEKAQLVYEEAKKIGGVRYLNPLESLLMRRVYLMKYSRNEEGKDRAVTALERTSTVTDGEALEEQYMEGQPLEGQPLEGQPLEGQSLEGQPDNTGKSGEASVQQSEEAALRQALVDYGNRLVSENLVQGTWGNLSVRLDDEHMLVTPSGVDYARLTAEDMVKVRISDLEYEGNLKPTSEKGLHAAIYKKRPDVRSVIHTHSTYCSVFAAAEKRLPIVIAEARKTFGTNVKLAKYGIPGSNALAEQTAEAVGENFGAIMAHHGMVALGSGISEAFENCVVLEKCARAALKA